MYMFIQALIYFILSNSSYFFSKNITRSFSFRSTRSPTERQILAALFDFPAGGEPEIASIWLSSLAFLKL
ncbi:hypothetical protein NE237_014260 [Protea cynaroides]|uniref:Uncharacterized protein n=1 Tax=Protea cynaroides TaxID=273540 RepID=A0A9Q0JT17_9MAGN|nr:hypothetical protein NE237_014260 [Protea cynaroides]